jgi:O-antigen biosynthesis protein WbqV
MRRARKRIGFLIYDTIALCFSLALALSLRMNDEIPAHMVHGMALSLPVFVASGLFIFHMFGIYDRVWRFASAADLTSLLEATALAIMTAVAILYATGNARWMPTSVPIIQWLVLVPLIAGGRVWRKVFNHAIGHFQPAASRTNTKRSPATPRLALIAGLPEHVEVVLRQIESSPSSNLAPIGILDASNEDIALRLRRIPILGGIDAIKHVVGRLAAQNSRPTHLIIADGGKAMSGSERLQLITAAETLGLSILRTSTPTEVKDGLDLEPINLPDLLGRPQTALDQSVLLRALKGRRVLVTGAGGTIGGELVRQIAAIEPAELLLLDCGEFNLYSIEMELKENFPHVQCRPLLCSIRQRQHVMAAFERFRPEFVFHAAALKHVPLVEENACAGVLTNVLGTRNVADAAARHGVKMMVQVSTDKAVNPVGIMGATKRLGELYCQALDLDSVGRPDAPRFMTVRFGNVLGSSGSLIPLFQRQLRRRAPLTVTDPEIKRFFMTVHEAVQLILHSMARGLECDVKRGRIIVLDMGEPIKIIDIARRMIRLAGLEPDRDVPIHIVGLRPGEKLFEELFDEREEQLPSDLPGVFEAEPAAVPLATLREGFEALGRAISAHDEAKVTSLLFEMIAPPPEIVAAPIPAPQRKPQERPVDRGWSPAVQPAAIPAIQAL